MTRLVQAALLTLLLQILARLYSAPLPRPVSVQQPSSGITLALEPTVALAEPTNLLAR